MAQLTLPPVAKSFYTFCKKCDADRYHKVLAHTSSTTAKIECEVCHSRKSYSLPKESSSRKTTTSGAAKPATSRTTHRGEYELRSQQLGGEPGVAYSIRAVFAENQKIQHPKFGIGFVQKVYSDRVDVIFSDEVKVLMHNKK